MTKYIVSAFIRLWENGMPDADFWATMGWVFADIILIVVVAVAAVLWTIYKFPYRSD